MNQSVIATSIQNGIQKFKQFRFADLRARHIIGVFALIAVLCVAGCGSVNSNTAPVITAQPVSTSVVAGATANFIAGANGLPAPTVQWQVSTNGGTSYTAVAGANSTGLSFTTTAAQNGNLYEAVFTNSVGSVTTSAATLTVTTAPVITTNPTNVTATAGTNATFTAAATGLPTPTVQWQVSTNGGTTFTNLAGATSTTLTLSAVTVAMSGNQYKAVFTNSAGTATSTAATLTVNPGITITTNPLAQTITAGTTATFTAAATGTPTPTVQWMVSTNGGTSFSAVPGATSTTLSFTTAAGQNGNLYEAVFTNTNGSTTTTAAALTVDFAPTITMNPVNLTVGNGDAATFTAAANGNPAPTVQWFVSTNGGAAYNAIGGATSTTLSFTAAAAQSGNLYEAVFTNSVTNSTTTPALLTVTGASNVSVAITNPSTTPFSLGTGGIINFAATIANGAAGTGVNWSVSGVAGGNSTVGTITASTMGGALATYTAPASAPAGGTVTIVATYAGAGSAVSPAAIVNVVANQDSSLSGQVAFQARGFALSGLPFGMVGTFTANGTGGLTNVLIDTVAVQSAGGGSAFTSKVAWNGSYSMDSANHGFINLSLASAPATKMNFSFTLNAGNGTMVEIDTPLGSTASGTFNAASSSAFTLAAGGLSGTYVMRLDGPNSPTGNGYIAILGQLTFAQTGSSTTAGTVTGTFSDNSGDTITTASPSTVSMDADGSGHGTVSFTLSNTGTAALTFYVSSAGRIYLLETDSNSAVDTGVLRSQTIPAGGFTASNVFTSAMLFEAIGVNTGTDHSSAIVGAFSPSSTNPTTQVVGEYDANDTGTVPGGSPVQLTGTFTVSPTVPGQGTLTFTNGATTVVTFTFYMQSPGQGFILEESAGSTESRVGQIVSQTEPAGGFVAATLNGTTQIAGTQTTTPTSGNGVAVIHFGTGTYTATADGSVLSQSPFIGGTSAGTVVFTDSVRGRAILTPSSGSIFGAATAVIYVIDNTGKAIIIPLDPTVLDPQIVAVGIGN
jgi:Immunoglobulin I-set domain